MGEILPFVTGSNALEPDWTSTNVNVDLDEADKMLGTLSTCTHFCDEIWFIDKVHTDKNISDSDRRISFKRIKNTDNSNSLKLWALSKLLMRQSIPGLIYSVNELKHFFEVLVPSNKQISHINQADLLRYHQMLFESIDTTSAIKNRLEKWYKVKAFFKSAGYQAQFYMMEKFLTPAFPEKQKKEEKYIPEEITAKLDVAFMKDYIPFHFKVIYWTLRLIPNRATEVLSMKMSCLKQITDEYYMITIPTFKQSGPYNLGDIKLIEIRNENIGKWYIDLLTSYIKQRQNESNSSDEDFLFCAKAFRKSADKSNNIAFKENTGSKYTLVSYDSVVYFFKTICELNGIRDNNGKPYSVTTHQFRHNNTSDRINSGLFRSIDIQGLTYHHTPTMIEQTYTHQDHTALAASAPVVFRGRIINTDNDSRINRLLDKPFAKRIHKLGICSDIRGCDKSKSHCLRCKYMIPSVDDVDFYIYELDDWKKKRDKAVTIGNGAYVELCEDWIESYEIVIERIINAVSNEDLAARTEVNKNEAD